MRCRFFIEEDEPCHLTITDVGGPGSTSVTNDAEAVVAHLLATGSLRAGKRLFYYDSTGWLDEITHDGAKFTGFQAGPRSPR